MNVKEALGIAMQASLKDCELIDFTVFGPRRSGTNYLQKIILLNTLNMRFLCLDKNFNDQDCKLVVDAFERIGSKHSMTDKVAAQKLNGNHISFVIAKENLKDWLYSRSAYQKTFQPEFKVSKNILNKWITKEYLEFFELITTSSHNRKLVFLKHEELTANMLREKLQLFDSNLILTKFPVETTTSMGPSGSITGKEYIKRVSKGEEIIDEYCQSEIFSQQINLQQQLISSLEKLSSFAGS